MHKWMYDRMIKEYRKKSKEELIQGIMAMMEIECKDRSFANQCQAGNAIYNINKLFEALEDLQSGFSYEKAAKVYGLAQSARNSWNYIRCGLAEINNDSRCSKASEDFKKRVNNAKDKMDLI